MKKGQFLGWFKKAYPDIERSRYGKTGVNLSIDGRVYGRVVCCGSDDEIEFQHGRGSTRDDAEIVSLCRTIFGNPRVVYQVSSDTSTKEKHEDTNTSTTVKVEAEKFNKDIVLNLLHEKFGDRLTEVSKNSKVETYVDGISGPILGNSGLSPNDKTRYKFVLYTDDEGVNQILTNFFTNFN